MFHTYKDSVKVLGKHVEYMGYTYTPRGQTIKGLLGPSKDKDHITKKLGWYTG